MNQQVHSSFIDNIIKHKWQIGVVGITTLICQFYLKYLKDKQDKETKKQKSKIKRRKSVVINHFKYDQQYVVPKNILQAENSLIDQIKYLNSPMCKIQKVPHLMNIVQNQYLRHIKSPLCGSNSYRNVFGGGGFLPDEAFVYKGSFILSKNTFTNTSQLANPTLWLLAGPRKYLYFKPSNVKAAIVTCGGLCPGLNVVIRQIFITLSILYQTPEIYGIPFGYVGFYSEQFQWVKLTLQYVKMLQYLGGTILGSSRGGFQGKTIVDALQKKGINQVYVIGGDGTHRGILAMSQIIKQRKLDIALIGIPKTIDNDIPIIDKSFGFETAVSQSIRAIRSAYVESRGVNYGIGLVRLMGRDAGFIAMEATNASRDVDVCLIPEFKFDLYGQFGVLEYITQQLKIKKHLVIVVAQGAGNGVRDLQSLKQVVTKDKSGNIKPPDIGNFLKVQIVKYLKEKGIEATLKYIDPTYMIRTVPANSFDRRLCAHLASCAVHGAMAGFTNFTVGYINNGPALIPITSLGAPNRVTQSNRGWQRVLAGNGQPSFLN